MKNRKWLELIDDFNDNDTEKINSLFGNIETFFQILEKKDLLHLIDPEADNHEDWINEWLLYLYNSGRKESFYMYVTTFLNDVELKNGKFYFIANYREDLSEVFCDNGSRYQSSRNIAYRILDNDSDDWESYDNTTDDVYNDVIKELTPKNLGKLYELILFDLKDVNVKTETELLENIAEEQNHPDYVVVDTNNIKQIVDDEETMNFLLGDHLSDLKSNLYSVHHNSYNSAYNDDIWEDVWSELQTYFNGRGEYVAKQVSTKDPKKTAEYFEIEIVNFESNIIQFLENNKRYGISGTLGYMGNYINVLQEDFKCLKIYPPDYPDSRKVDKYINEYFNDYV